jgi:ferredoxin--NADP+ reductase
MYKISNKKALNDSVTSIDVAAPLVARKAKAGQFIILRVDENGERIPLTVADADAGKGTVRIIFQKVGLTTKKLDRLENGGYILDFVGPLGRETEVEGIKKAAVIGGGVGCAIAYPTAKTLKAHGAHVTTIAGFRNKDLVILEQEFKAVSDSYTLVTDDGSAGTKGLVTDALEKLIAAGEMFDAVFAIGPIVMMKYVSLLTKKYGIRTIVSMNPIMVDGTGMCGGCRLTVGGEVKFACVDGPEFDGHLVDFDGAIKNSGKFKGFESHACRLKGNE